MKKFLACLFILAALPLLASTVHNKSVPFASVAFAGHVVGGGAYTCTCGCYECICDSGETPIECPQGLNRIPNPVDGSLGQADSPITKPPASDFDFSSSALILALAFFMWARFLRA